MPAPHEQPAPDDAVARRHRDELLLAELEHPDLDESRESLAYWRERHDGLPRHRRAERREAQEMVTTWRQRVAEAERALHGPGLLEQALDALGVRWRPDPRRLLAGAAVAGVLTLVLVVALLVAAVVFWNELEPILRFFLGGQDGGDGGDG